MPANKKQCLLCGQQPHFGACDSQELFVPIPGGCCEEDEVAGPLATTVLEPLPGLKTKVDQNTISPIGAALRLMVAELLQERKAS